MQLWPKIYVDVHDARATADLRLGGALQIWQARYHIIRTYLHYLYLYKTCVAPLNHLSMGHAVRGPKKNDKVKLPQRAQSWQKGPYRSSSFRVDGDNFVIKFGDSLECSQNFKKNFLSTILVNHSFSLLGNIDPAKLRQSDVSLF